MADWAAENYYSVEMPPLNVPACRANHRIRLVLANGIVQV